MSLFRDKGKEKGKLASSGLGRFSEYSRGDSSPRQEGKDDGPSDAPVVQAHQMTQAAGWMLGEGEVKGLRVAI